MESKDRIPRTYIPQESQTLPPDISPSTGGTVKRKRGGREISITVGKQSAFTEEGELTTVPIVPDARGRPRPLQPMELQSHLASQGLGDQRVNEKATRQRFAIARHPGQRRRPK